MTMSKRRVQADTSVLEKEDRDRILLEQLPQVRYLATRIRARMPQYVPLEDLVHAGVIGLIDALSKFDSSRHVPFASYAKIRIRGAILDSLREMDWAPRELRRQARRIQEARRKLSQHLNRTATDIEVSVELNIELGLFQQLLNDLNRLEVSSLNVRSSYDGREEEEMCDRLPGPPEKTPFLICARSEMKVLLVRLVADLPQKQQDVLGLYYFKELTLKEVGTILRIGESRVSQIRALAVHRLRARMEELIGSAAAPPAAVAQEN
jgi:RNA polymerase sigma factor FliA